MKNFIENLAKNLTFALEFAAVIFAMFLIAYVFEKLAKKKHPTQERILTTRKLAVTGMFSALALLLHLFDFPIGFAPFFYKLDFSELPILIGTFAFGPVSGVMMEFLKILLKLCIKGTSTAFVGDLANFVIGCSMILPASIIYAFGKTKKCAILGCVVGTLSMTILGTAFNAIYLIPAFSVLFGMPIESILEMGAKVNPLVSSESLFSFVVACVAPMNLIKGGAASLITMLVYKKLSPVLKTGHRSR